MNSLDFFLVPLYLIIILVTANFYKKNNYHKGPEFKYFNQGLIIKIFGALIAGIIYQFYYGGGDTFNFYIMTSAFYDTFKSDPASFFRLLFIESGDYSQYDLMPHIGKFYSWYYKEDSAFFVSKIGGVFSIFTFNSYALISIFFACFSYIGVWSLYRTFCKLFPKLYKTLAFTILFIPSVWFWGSGLFKDTVALGCVGLLTACIYKIFVERKISLITIILALISIYFIYIIKTYILISFIPALAIFIFSLWKSRIKYKFLRRITTPVILILTLVIAQQYISSLDSVDGTFKETFETIEQTQDWHTKISEQGRTYSRGSYDASITGIIQKMPLAVNVALFRPYIWEAQGALLLITALENLFILFYSVYILIVIRPLIVFNIISNHPILNLSLIFTIILGFIIGFTTYNFGALARYKIPLIPYYVSTLFIIKHIYDESRVNS